MQHAEYRICSPDRPLGQARDGLDGSYGRDSDIPRRFLWIKGRVVRREKTGDEWIYGGRSYGSEGQPDGGEGDAAVCGEMPPQALATNATARHGAHVRASRSLIPPE
jgi:hypothetical protein